MTAIVTDYKGGHQSREWRTAWTALRKLINEQDDTDQVFIIMKALAGNAHDKQFKKFIKTPVGQRVITERLNILDQLDDREYLRNLPDDSLGKAYLNFVESEDLSAQVLVDASAVARKDVHSKDLIRYFDRSRDVHDLWHVITGYGRDGLGEACVVAFSYPQTKSLGFAAIALMAGYEFKRILPKSAIWSSIWQAYQNGKKANWLMGESFEELLPMTVEDVRKKLNINEPTKYLNSPEAIKETRDFKPKQ